ncbi:MAG: hypothetical protein IT450_14760 [Phycisphaerales bacterium]|nr:hypothetical protein [Phycisphaerales bacterium]
MLRPILGLPRSPVAEPIPPGAPAAASPPRTILAALGFLGILGLLLAARAVQAEFERQADSPAGSVSLVVGAVLLGVGMRLSFGRRTLSSEATGKRPADYDALTFTALALAAVTLVAAIGFAESLRAAVSIALDLPAFILLLMLLAPGLAVVALNAAVAAHVVRTAAPWYQAAGRRVLVASVLAAAAGSAMPLGRQGVVIVAPLALFLAALVVLLRHPGPSGSIPQPPLPGWIGRACGIGGAAALLLGSMISVPAGAPREGGPALPDAVARRWEIRQTIDGPAALAACDLHGLDTPTLLVTGGEQVLDADAPRFAARLARAGRTVGRVLFEEPCNERLVRRVRRELRRGGEFPAAYAIRLRDGAREVSLIAVGFDIPAWLDARPLPGEYHLEFGLDDAPGPRAGE